ncbi:hypothetical protein CLAFUW4_00101 [Fulvia fulva]|uniref:Uncharacterized protein n=1 Tax=Passalora fulva TaxID=5499 RepID=A0A9Q8P3X0_PASFU|nr:uncharacterized protein CLAFUR5_00099 [Fulvia fulva]KAK4635977.1 hypothetical protein CLAFUR4_00101 [Fulvia fulva]KAK4638566.1 hypothetical protein CLAFUR0_00100 [Fulvia fulva]UJO12465.1 hypothetical protein CLAFUR5_00099 [Fulvia fulva]WPV09101.1 hypothetical protein CLAFUW4_00101 [Fulvia fulva]WPV25123.1 hypothetical protein CLAFUW7_00101 [Fulvia fulva]
MEADIVTPATMGRVQKWIQSLPEAGIPSRELEALVDTVKPAEALDDWDAAEVEICDSWSLMADGARRRRIDKWRALSSAVDVPAI